MQAWNAILLRYFNPVGAHKSGRIGEDPQVKAIFLIIIDDMGACALKTQVYVKEHHMTCLKSLHSKEIDRE